jgi:hypothetical protein
MEGVAGADIGDAGIAAGVTIDGWRKRDWNAPGGRVERALGTIRSVFGSISSGGSASSGRMVRRVRRV